MIEIRDKYIYFCEDVTNGTIKKFIECINSEIEKHYATHDINTEYEVIYVINTNGGSIMPMLQFVDFITIIKNQYPKLSFKSIISGLVCGILLTCVADKKYITENSYINMIDILSSTTISSVELNSCAHYVVETNEFIAEICTKNSSINKDQYKKLCLENTVINANNALTYGFVDEIIKEFV